MSRRRPPERPYKLGLIIPDSHVPNHDTNTLHAILKYANDERWDWVIHLGDLMDLDCISSHNMSKARLTEGQRILHDYDAGNTLLDDIQDAGGHRNDKCKFVLLEGNHEYRVERFVDEFPVLEGNLEIANGLRLKERKIKWVRTWSRGEVFKIGKANFIHGMWTNVHHAKKHVEAFGANIYYGHTHDVQTYSATHLGRDETLEGGSMGCTCLYELKYMRGRPNKWQQAFGVIRVFPDGYYDRSVVRVFKHRFVGPTNGLVYDGLV